MVIYKITYRPDHPIHLLPFSNDLYIQDLVVLWGYGDITLS
jgi:hypothetical protein